MVWEVEHHDHLMGQEVASSMPHASRCPPSRVVARIVPQRAAEHASVAQSQPVPNGPLAAARELLRNPPSTTASPDAQRQWRDNVDRLLNMAQVTPGSAGGSVSRQRGRQGGASGSVHSPSARSAQTEDLWAELNTDVRERMPASPSSGLARAGSTLRSVPWGRARRGCGKATGTRPGTGGWGGLRSSHGPPPSGGLAIQVSAAPVGKVRRVNQPVGIPAGLHHRHQGGWR
jgi:hypothetical protein